MNAAVPILPVVLALAVVASAQTTSIRLAVELPEAPTTAGARVFAEKSCIRCHSLGDSGGARVGPNLGRMQFSGSILDLAGTFWNHSPVMRERMRQMKIQSPTLSRTEMTELLAFLAMNRYYVAEVGQPGDVAAGRVVFTGKGCVRCHGDADTQAAPPKPELHTYRGSSAPLLLAQAMWNHPRERARVIETRAQRPAGFAGREMADLIAYLRAGRVDRSVQPVYFQPGSRTRGRALFRSTGCSGCHTMAGQGDRGAPDAGTHEGALIRSVSETAGVMWNHSQQMTAEFDRRGIPRVTLSAEEMADIIAYLHFANYADVRGRPADGEHVFVAKCAMCHSVGGGPKVGPDLAAVPGLDGPIAIVSAMWNHAPMMELRMLERGLPWPRLEPGDPADLIAFLLSRLEAPVGLTVATP